MIGIDIIAISRVEKFIKKFEKRALDRFLNEREQELAKKVESIAGFWASKEAVSKALKCGIGKDLSFADIEIFKDRRGAPYLKFSSEAIERFNIVDSSLSISHDGGFAIAVVVVSTATNKI